MKLLDLKRVADNLVLRAISSSAGVQLNNIAGTLSLLRSDIANTYADLVAKTITMPSAGGTYQSTLTAASSQSASISHSLPPALPTVNGQVLTGTTGGAMQWANPTTGTITGVTATAPVLSSGGTAPVISIPTPTANQLLAGPLSGGAAAAAFRALAAGDLPVIGGLTPGAYGNASLTVDTYGRVTAVSAGVAGQVFPPAADLPMGSKGFTGLRDPVAAQEAATKAYTDARSGVVSVGASGVVASSGGANPVISIAVQAANTFLAGGASGVPIVPTARALVAADLPAVAGVAGAYTNSSVTVDAYGRVTVASTGTAGQTFPPAADLPMGVHKLTGVLDPTLAQDAATKAYVDAHAGVTTVTATSPVLSSGGASPAISLATQAANTFLAGGASGVPIVPTARALVSADLPAVAGVAGAYTNSSVTVDAYGRVTVASTGTAGQTFPPAADLPMGAHKLTGVATPTLSTDAATKAYADSVAGQVFPPVIDLSMGTHKLTSLATPTLATDAATKAYVDGLAGVTTVTANAPLASSGGTTPAISVLAQAPNTVLAGPAVAGANAVPTARALVSADFPVIGGLTPGAYGNASLTVDTYGRVTAVSAGVAGQVFPPAADLPMGSKGFTGLRDPVAAQEAATKAYTDARSGVVSVGASGVVASSGGANPVISIAVQAANTFLAGGASGVPIVPTARTIVSADLPAVAGVAGAYTNSSVTVDAYGRVTVASTGTAGQTFPPAADLPMGAHKLTGVATPTLSTDAATKAYADSVAGQVFPPVIDLSMGTHKLTSLATPTLATDAATKAYVDGLAGVTTVTASAPLASSGGTTPAISVLAQAPNTVLAGPAVAGANAVPTARALVSADFPTIAGLTAGAYTNTSVTVNTKGVITAAVSGAVGQVFPPSADVPMGGFKLTGLATPIATTDASTKAYVDALGRVTAVTATAPVASTGGSTPVISLNTQAANTFLAGGASGVPIVPTARALVSADLPAVAGVAGAYTNSSVTVDAYGRVSAISTGTAGQTFPPAADLPMGTHKLTGVLDPTLAQDAATKAYVDAHAGVTTVTATSPVLSSGGASPAISLATQAANTFLAGGASGGSIVPTARTIVGADLASALTAPPPIGTLTPSTGAFSSVAINQPSPAAKFHVKDSVTPQAVIESTSAVTTWLEFRDGNASQHRMAIVLGLTTPTDGKFGIYDAASAAPRLTVDTNGRIGINQTTPVAMLEVDSNTSSTKGLIVKGAASQSVSLQEWQNNGTTALATVDANGIMYNKGIIDTSAALTVSFSPAGISITYSAGSTSHAGNIVITTSASITPQALGNYSFASAFTNKPGVAISTIGVNSYGIYISAMAANAFQIANATTIPTSTTITISYVVIGATA